MSKDTIQQNTLEAMELTIAERLSREFPSLYWDKLALVNTTTTRLGIDDISYRANTSVQDDIETLQLSCKGWLETYNAQYVTRKLTERLRGLLRTIDRRKTLVIFPGNGACIIKDLLPDDLLDGVQSVDLPVQRKINADGSVGGVEILGKTAVRQALTDTKAQNIIVIDDVIASGATLKAIQEAFPTRNTEWFATSLLMLSPLQSRGKEKGKSGILGYQTIISPLVYQGTSGIPPLNSLSTLIGTSQKSNVVRENYLRDYVEDPTTFLDAITAMRRKIGGNL